MKKNAFAHRAIEAALFLIFVLACAFSVSAATAEWVVDGSETYYYINGKPACGIFAAAETAPQIKDAENAAAEAEEDSAEAAEPAEEADTQAAEAAERTDAEAEESGEQSAKADDEQESEGNAMRAFSSSIVEKGSPASPVYYYSDGRGVVFRGTGWIVDPDTGKIYYAYEDGKLYNNIKKNIDGSTYIFKKSDCSVATGLVNYRGCRYMGSEAGAVYKNLLVEYKGNLYFAQSNGVLATNAVMKFGTCYSYFGSDGKMVVNGWVNSGGKTYYAGADGSFITNRIKNIGGAAYCFKKDTGELLRGPFSYRSKRYCSNNKGVIRKNGWISWGGKRYYAQSDGVLYVYTIKTIGGDRYCFSSGDGHVMTGSFTYRGTKYFADESGIIRAKTTLPKGTKLIDVSEFQYEINWSRVKASGINYAIIRLGYRGSASGSLITDYRFHQNIKNAKKAGIKVGVYFFSAAETYAEGKEEANYVLKVLNNNGYTLNLPIVIDTETCPGGRYGTAANNNTRAGRTRAVLGFCERIKSAGRTPMIYASTSWLNGKLDMSKLSKYQLWVAQYYYKCEYKGGYRVWQYSSSGKVSGISGKVDMNYIYY